MSAFSADDDAAPLLLTTAAATSRLFQNASSDLLQQTQSRALAMESHHKGIDISGILQYVRACMHARARVHTRTCAITCACASACLCLCLCLYLCVRVLCICVCVYACTRACSLRAHQTLTHLRVLCEHIAYAHMYFNSPSYTQYTHTHQQHMRMYACIYVYVCIYTHMCTTCIYMYISIDMCI